jgi:hypothetical protein
MPTRYLTKTRLAQLLGISKQLVGHYARGVLKAAVSEAGIDLDHPDVVVFLARFETTPDELVERDGGAPIKKRGRPARGLTRELVAPVLSGSTLSTTGSTLPMQGGFRDPPDAEQLYRLTFRQIVERWGHLEGFQNWIELRKKTAETRRVELRNSEAEGLVISREFVRVHVFGYLEAANRLLLTDAARTLARQLPSAARNGAAHEAVEQAAREIISGHLVRLKAEVVRAIRAHPVTNHGTA